MASVTSVASPAHMGRALYRSFHSLLEKNLDTEPVAHVHGLITRAAHTVDADLTPFLFGSTAVYGYHEPGTDADFVVLNRQDIQDGKGADAASEVAKALQADTLAKLMTALQQPAEGSGRAALLWRAELVRRTRVPVLRVKGAGAAVAAAEVADKATASLASSPPSSSSVCSSSRNVDFDVTASRRNGVRNSALLRSYYAQQPHTRWLGIAVKQWSKRSGLNMGVEGGCLTSYGFNLMVAYYLLQRKLVGFVPPESCDVAHIPPMPPYLPLGPPAQEGKALGEMMLDFLAFYMNEFNPDKEVISLSRPGKTTKEDLQWTKRAEDMARISGDKTNYRWCIEDPYEVNLNVGRHVTPFKLMLLKKHLERARDTCMLLELPPSSPAKKGAKK